MTEQFLYRLSDAEAALLYLGISEDWSRRIRQHVLGKPWAGDIANVRLERFPSRAAVLSAEAAAIRAEHPLHNIQHNGGHAVELDVDLAPGRTWTAEDIILVAGLVVLAAYAIYMGTTIAIEKYRERKAERAEFMAWKQARALEAPASDPEPVPTEDDPVSAPAVTAEAAIVSEPVPVTGPELVGVSEPLTASIFIPKPAPVQPLPAMAVRSPVAALAFCTAFFVLACNSNIDTARLTHLYPTRPTARPN